MASLFNRTVISLTCKLFRNANILQTRQCLQLVNQCKAVTMPKSCVRGIARSFWSMGDMSSKSLGSIASGTKLSDKCGCCSLHTEGDTEFSKFLEKEINVEQSTDRFSKKVPEITDWKITTDVSNITMSRVMGDETIDIKFNVVDSVDAEEPYSMQEGEEEKDEVANTISKPPFTVEIKKSSGKVLCLKCSFPMDDMPMEGEEVSQEDEDAIEDEFQIDEVSIYQNTPSETAYSVLSSTMDGILYDMLMDMLDERGVSNEFIKAMVEYSTQYEQRLYVTFLKDLKSYVDEK